jgi:hypothetical protein
MRHKSGTPLRATIWHAPAPLRSEHVLEGSPVPIGTSHLLAALARPASTHPVGKHLARSRLRVRIGGVLWFRTGSSETCYDSDQRGGDRLNARLAGNSTSTKQGPCATVMRRPQMLARPMQSPAPDFCSDLDEVLRYLGLGDKEGLAFFHRAQDLQSFLMHREAVKLLRDNPALAKRVEATLSRWRTQQDSRKAAVLAQWTEIVEARNWDAALANTEVAQQLRQASPLAGVLPDDTRLGIIRYISALKRSG